MPNCRAVGAAAAARRRGDSLASVPEGRRRRPVGAAGRPPLGTHGRRHVQLAKHALVGRPEGRLFRERRPTQWSEWARSSSSTNRRNFTPGVTENSRRQQETGPAGRRTRLFEALCRKRREFVRERSVAPAAQTPSNNGKT